LTPELAFTGTVPAVALAVSAALVVSATSSMYYAQRVTALRIAHCSFEALL
jgi:hypothetical protein